MSEQVAEVGIGTVMHTLGIKVNNLAERNKELENLLEANDLAVQCVAKTKWINQLLIAVEVLQENYVGEIPKIVTDAINYPDIEHEKLKEKERAEVENGHS